MRAAPRSRSRRCAGLWTLALASLSVAGCGGAVGKTTIIHAERGEAARAVWSVDFTHEFTVPENFRYRTEEYGSATADPARGLVYAGSRDGTLLALEDRRGEFAWELDLGGGLSGRPLMLRVEGDAEQGTTWVAAPGERADWMLVGTDDGALVAVDLDTREVVWRYRTTGVIRTQPVLGEGVVHFVNSRDEIVTLDVRLGEYVWQFSGAFQKDFTVFGRAGLAYLPPRDATAGDSGVLFTGFADGKVIALDATSGSTRWLTPLAPTAGKELFIDVDTTPLLYPERGELVVANQSSGVFALDLADGSRRWNTEIKAVGSIVEGPGLYVAASSLEGLAGIEFDGRVRWREQTDPGSLSTPLVVGDTLFVAHSDAGLFAFEARTGELLSSFFNGSGSSGEPVYDPVLNRVYASSDRGVLYALRLLGQG